MKAIRVNANEIRNPSAYNRGIANAIKRNAATRRSREWLAIPGNSRVSDWLHQVGEFNSTCACGRTVEQHNGHYDEQCRNIEHPATRGMFSSDFGAFLLDMRDALVEWGSLTENQTATVAKALARTEKRIADREAARAEELAADRAGSNHIGTVGERREFSLTVEKVFSFETAYGFTYINICRDSDGNVVVYKGSNGWDKGEIKVKATVKEHSVREGVKQTIIARPKAA
jgi:hypothetical protein